MSDELRSSDPLAQPILPDNPFRKLADDNTLDPANEIETSIVDEKFGGRTALLPANDPNLVAQPHGGFLRKNGAPKGVPQNRPISSTAKVRDAMREGLARVLPTLYDAVAEGKINRLQFADFLAKYSIGTTGTIALISPDVTRRLEQQVALIASRPTWEASELLEAMRDIWAL